MLKKACILHSDQRLDQIARQFIIARIEPMPLFEYIGELPAVSIQYHTGDFRLVVDQLVGIELDLFIGIDKCRSQCYNKDRKEYYGSLDQTMYHVLNSLLAKLAPINSLV